MTVEKLIEELRKVYEYYFCSTVVHPSGLNVRMMAKNCADKLEEMKDELAKEKRRAEKAIARIKAFDEMGWFCRWRDGGACTINGKREICRKGTVNGTKNPCRDWEWRGDAEEGDAK